METTTADRPPIRIWLRLLLFVGAVLLFLIVFTVISINYQRYASKSRLQAFLDRLDKEDPGWRLEEIEAARPDPPAGKNSAELVLLLAPMVPPNWPKAETQQLLDFSLLPPPEMLDEERVKTLEEEMGTVSKAVTVARQFADLPQGKFRIRWTDNPLNVLLADQQNSRRAASLLYHDAIFRIQKKDFSGALLSSRACINVGRSLGDEPIAISQLIRVACITMGLSSVERTLAQGQASDNDLVEVQKLLRLEERHPTRRIVIRGERAMQYQIYEMLKAQGVSPASLMGGAHATSWSKWRNWFMSLGMNLPRQQFLTLELMTEMAEIAELPPAEQIKREAEFDKKVRDLSSREMLVRLLMPAMTRMNEALRRKLAQIRCMDALIALERYRMRQGKWPEKLADLPKELLPTIPQDPYDGKPIRYQQTAEGVVVYAVGENLSDDGGKVERDPRMGRSLDWGYRLWDVDKRRQPAKAKEAAPLILDKP